MKNQLAALLFLCGACFDLDALQSENNLPPVKPVDMTLPPLPPDLSVPAPARNWSMVAAPSMPLRAIRGWDSRKIWAVGDGYQLVAWNGVLWSASSIPSPPNGYFNSIWFRARDQVYVAGQSGNVMLNANGVWSSMKTTVGYNLYALTGRDATVLQLAGAGSNPDNKLDVWANAWSRLDYSGWPGALWGAWTQPEADFFCGTVGVLRLPAGGTVLSREHGTVDGITYWALWGTTDGSTWAAGSDGHIAKLQGGAWNDQQVFPGHTLRALSGTSPADLWVVGDDAFAAHFDGAVWRQQQVPPATGYHLTGVWADSATGNLYASGATTSDTAGAVFAYQ